MLSELFRMDKILGFCEKVCYFFLINLLFLLSCLPVLLFFMFVGISQVRDCLPLFLLCMLSVPPALSAIFFSMNRLLHKTETKVLNDYLKGYVMDFPQKLKLGAAQMLLIIILVTNVEFFAKQIPVLPVMILFAVLFLFVILITPFLYLLSSRYKMKGIDLIKAACILTVTKPGHTLGNAAAAGIILMALELSAGTTVLFMAPVYGFLIVFINRNVLDRLEKESNSDRIS